MCDDEYDITSQLIPFDEEKAAKAERISDLIKFFMVMNYSNNSFDEMLELFKSSDHEELCIALSNWLIQRRKISQRFKEAFENKKPAPSESKPKIN